MSLLIDRARDYLDTFTHIGILVFLTLLVFQWD